MTACRSFGDLSNSAFLRWQDCGSQWAHKNCLFQENEDWESLERRDGMLYGSALIPKGMCQYAGFGLLVGN